MRFRDISALAMALSIGLVAGSAHGQYDDPPVGGDPDAPANCEGVQARVTLDAATLTFNPSRVVIAPGAPVCWTWSGMPHSVRADNASFGSGPPTPNGTFQKTFETPGTFGYYCQVHGTALAGMRGEVVVQSGDDPAPSGPGTLQVAAAALTVAENVGNAQITIERVGGSDGKATVLHSTAPGTAKNNRDFKPLKNKLFTWNPGELGPKTALIALKNDKAKEPTEAFSLVLSKPTGATLGASVTAVTVTDDDSPTCPASTVAPALRAAGQSATEIRLAWPSHASSEGLLHIERSRDGGVFQEIAAVGAGVGSYVDTGLMADTTYLYRVRRADGDGSPIYSESTASSTDGAISTCSPGRGALCLENGRFEVRALWSRGTGEPRRAALSAAFAESDAAALFTLPDEGPALLVGIVSSCARNDHYGVTLAAIAPAEFTVRIRDTVTGRIWTRFIPAGGPTALRDAEAFATCP